MKEIEPILFWIGNAAFDLVAFGSWFLVAFSTIVALRLLIKSWDSRFSVRTRILSSGAASALLTASLLLSLLSN